MLTDHIGPNSHRRVGPINTFVEPSTDASRAGRPLAGRAPKKMYDAARPSPSRIYGRRWQRLHVAYLARNPLCQCEENDGAGCGRPAVVVDHRTPHNGDPVLL
jgi:hypothetical protein